ncbi:MAG: hypothetical protein ACTSSP_06535 [Candidatus Asgardarchaeia archaeon]
MLLTTILSYHLMRNFFRKTRSLKLALRRSIFYSIVLDFIVMELGNIVEGILFLIVPAYLFDFDVVAYYPISGFLILFPFMRVSYVYPGGGYIVFRFLIFDLVQFPYHEVPWSQPLEILGRVIRENTITYSISLLISYGILLCGSILGISLYCLKFYIIKTEIRT